MLSSPRTASESVAPRAVADRFDSYLAKPVGEPALHAALADARRPRPADGRPPRRQASSLADAPQGRLLLADDNEINRIVAVDLLRRPSARVESPSEGAAGGRVGGETPHAST